MRPHLNRCDKRKLSMLLITTLRLDFLLFHETFYRGWTSACAPQTNFYKDMSETLQLRGTLLGHNGWVTQIATNPKDPDTIISASRGKYATTIIAKPQKVWLCDFLYP